jgi:hypothetical protein
MMQHLSPGILLRSPPRCAAAGHARVRLGLLRAIPQEQPLERIPLTSVQERLEQPSSAPPLAAPPPAARAAAPAAPVAGFQRAATGNDATK